MNESMRPTRKPTQHPATRPGDIAPLSIDRVVREQALGDVVASDQEKDATPIVLYSKGGTVSLKLSDASSKGATLCLAAAVKLKAK